MPKLSGDSPERAAVVLCPEGPYPVEGGGAARTASVLEYIVTRYILDVIVFREPGSPDPRCAFPAGLAREIHVIDLPYHSRGNAARVARNAVRVLRARPPLNDRFAGFDREIERCLAGRRYDLAIIEHFWCAPYAAQFAGHSERTILDLHNVESALYASSGRAARGAAAVAFDRFARAAAAMERRWLPQFTAILVTSNADGVRVRDAAASANVLVYPNAIRLVPPLRIAEQEAIAFSGNLEYGPNVSAIRFFQSQIWPRLRERWPKLKWHIIGRNAHAVAGDLKDDPRIELVGPVRDAIAALAASRVVVVPVLAGSGTRVKILEAWAAERAVVSTTAGAEGLGAAHDRELLLADDPGSFAEAVSRLLESPGDRQRLGAAGRALYESRYTWDRAWEILAGYRI